MNQIDIGKFIAHCRKELNMTQADIADKLGITNKAVSKWENGKNLPDASLMIDLCDLLNISVNELLSAKKLNKEEEKQKDKQNTLQMVMARKELENLSILTEVLILVGIIVAMTLTSVLADTTIEKIITLILGSFVWGYGLFMRVKLKKALLKMNAYFILKTKNS